MNQMSHPMCTVVVSPPLSRRRCNYCLLYFIDKKQKKERRESASRKVTKTNKFAWIISSLKNNNKVSSTSSSSALAEDDEVMIINLIRSSQQRAHVVNLIFSILFVCSPREVNCILFFFSGWSGEKNRQKSPRKREINDDDGWRKVAPSWGLLILTINKQRGPSKAQDGANLKKMLLDNDRVNVYLVVTLSNISLPHALLVTEYRSTRVHQSSSEKREALVKFDLCDSRSWFVIEGEGKKIEWRQGMMMMSHLRRC